MVCVCEKPGSADFSSCSVGTPLFRSDTSRWRIARGCGAFERRVLSEDGRWRKEEALPGLQLRQRCRWRVEGGGGAVLCAPDVAKLPPLFTGR